MAYIVRTMTEIDVLADKLRPIVNGDTAADRGTQNNAEVMWDTIRWFTESDAQDPYEYHIGEEEEGWNESE